MQANEMKFNFQLKFDSLFEFSAPAYDDRQIGYLLTEAQFRVFLKRYNPLADKYKKGFEADEQRRRDLEQLIKPATIYGEAVTGLATYSCTWATVSGVTTVEVGSGGTLTTTLGLNAGEKVYATGIGPTGTTGENVIKYVVNDTKFVVESVASTASQASPTTVTGGLGKSQAQGGTHPSGVFLDMPSDFLYAVEEAAKLKISGVLNTSESWVKPVKHDEYLANINNPYKQPYKDLIWRIDISRVQHASGTSILSTPKRTELVLPANAVVNTYRLRYLATPPAIVCDEFTPANQRHCILDETLHREIVDEAVIIAQASVKPEQYQIGVNEQERND